MEHTDEASLVKAMQMYRDKYGKGDVDLEKLEAIIRSNRKKRKHRRKK
jgi:hypothetical protein